jgi:PRTRC genetic system ThiF family protein
MDFELKNNFVLDVKANEPKHFVLIGCGGNGAYFIRDFIRQVAIQNMQMSMSLDKRSHCVTVIDADEVEDKNLTRQNFVQKDVGSNKSQILANRYGSAFGVPIRYVPEYIQNEEHLLSIIQGQPGTPVILGAVDNNKTRKIIYDTYKKLSGAFWIDAGNEQYAGQVVCGYNYPSAPDTSKAREPHQFYMPCAIDIYPEIAEATDKLPGELSCAERSVSAPQNIFTNITAATIMMGFANIILTASNVAEGEGLRCHAVTFNTHNTIAQTTRLNHEDLLAARYVAPPVAEAPEAPVPTPAVKKPASKKKKAPASAAPVPAPTA